MFGKRPVLLVDCRRFVSRQNSAPHLLGPPFQAVEQRASGRFIAATSRHFLHQPGAVPILGGVGLRGNHDTVSAVLPDGNGCRPALLFRVEPFGEPLPLANDNLRTSRQRLGCGLLEYASQISPFSLPASSRSMCLSFRLSLCQRRPCQVFGRRRRRHGFRVRRQPKPQVNGEPVGLVEPDGHFPLSEAPKVGWVDSGRLADSVHSQTALRDCSP